MKIRKHMSMSIEGALRNYGRKSMAGLLIDDDGRKLTNAEVRAELNQALAEGKRLLPMGDCEGFDYQKGCPGHPIE